MESRIDILNFTPKFVRILLGQLDHYSKDLFAGENLKMFNVTLEIASYATYLDIQEAKILEKELGLLDRFEELSNNLIQSYICKTEEI